MEEPLSFGPGYAAVPEAPGLGIKFDEKALSKVVVEGNQATRLVQIVDADNQTWYYAFRLKLQKHGDYAGMWLTEAVWPLQNPDRDVLAL